MEYDDDNQDYPYRFNSERLINRHYDELVGICRGVIADGKVNCEEAAFLKNWLDAHADIVSVFPANILASRLADALQDAQIDKNEAEELILLLKGMTGEKGQQGKGDVPTDMGFNDPMPELDFERQSFVLTGQFVSGKRSKIEELLETLGGYILPDVRMCCCLIVGSLATPAWIHSTHGRKLEKAILYRDNPAYEHRSEIIIVSENHMWSEIERLGLMEKISPSR